MSQTQSMQNAIPSNFALDITNNKLTVSSSDISYMNGDYVASSSSTFGGVGNTWTAINCFDNNDATFWHVPWTPHGGYTQGPYTSGKYIGGGTSDTYFKTTTTAGTIKNGEWIQIQLPYTLSPTSFSILNAQHCCPERFPKRFSFLGSRDGSSWDVINTQDIDKAHEKYDTSKHISFNIPNVSSKSYYFFRIVFEEQNNHPSCNVVNIAGIQIYGKPCQTLNGNCETFSNIMPQIEGLSTMENQNDVLTKIIQFNKDYATYIDCTENNSCAIDKVTLLAQLTDLNTSITSTTNSITTTTTNTTPALFDASHNNVVTTHEENELLRREIDSKMMELSDHDNSFSKEKKTHFDNTILSNALWSVVGTSALYFVFKNM